MKTYKKVYQSGFTIIELSLAMTMLSVLLIIILLSILNITSTYNRGLTLKRVNQSGRTISTELQTNLRKSTPSGSDDVTASNIKFRSNPPFSRGGEEVLTRLCTSHDSFVWNVYGDGGAKTNEKYEDGSEVFGMIRISDPNGTMCDPNPPIVAPKKSDSKNLLGDELVMRQPVKLEVGSSGRLVRFTFTISTPDDNGSIVNGACQGGKGGDFCGLNTFVVTSYAKGI